MKNDLIKIDIYGFGEKAQIGAPEYQTLLRNIQEGESCYSDGLGWLDTEEWANNDWVTRSIELANQAKAIADTFIVIGIGGSNNSVRALLGVIGERTGMNILYAGNTLSEYSFKELKAKLEGHDFVIDCIAKNFETLEPGVAFRFLRDLLVKRYGEEKAAERIFCTGTIGSHFEKISQEEGYTFIPFPSDIGGRYTAISPVHLVPMAAAGADIREVVRGASEMARILRTLSSDNPALMYAAMRNLFYRRGYHIEMLSSFEPRLRWFYKWWEQLFAESEGKNGKGLFPATSEFSEELHSLGQFIQDGSPIMFETFLHVDDVDSSLLIPSDSIDDRFDYLNGMTLGYVNNIAEEATIRAHSKKCPCIKLSIKDLSEYSVGALFYFFEFSCYLSGRLLGVNPFDQPGVEEYKALMFNRLGRDLR